jgi:hypothetical protein
MSKAVNIRYTENIQALFKRLSAMSCFNPGSIPSIPDIPFPDLPSYCPSIPSIDRRVAQHAGLESSQKEPIQTIPQDHLQKPYHISQEDFYLDMVSFLNKSGCTVKDIKQLPSGDRRITLSELFDDIHIPKREFEYINKR